MDEVVRLMCENPGTFETQDLPCCLRALHEALLEDQNYSGSVETYGRDSITRVLNAWGRAA
jgi:hypothetical protein